ncbi:DUF6297 family protein [Modestobacter roseus]|uniref:DUF6297 family protein n=1 Tax=Modestobacter roseus TaxID=1181884 RepID=UPI0014125E80|nr:DUF6297 family protein [Modestobacter roseus]
MVGGTVSSLREQIAARPATGTAVLPGAVTSLVAAVLVVAGLAWVLARLGPVSATPAAAAWWLPLPADRRGLLRGELVRVVLVSATAAALVVVPVLLAVPVTPAAVDVLVGVATAALLTAAGAGLLVVLQAAGRGHRLPTVAGALACVAVVGAALTGAVLAAVDAAPVTGWAVQPAGTPLVGAAVVAAVLAVLAVVAADRRLDRLRAGDLRARGEIVQYATASTFSMDTRELGRALASSPRPPRRARRWRRVSGAPTAVLAADLAVLTRSPWRWGQLAVGAALPVLAARTSGLGDLPALVAVAAVLGWALAAVALGEPSRRAQASPALDRVLPLSADVVVRLRVVVPLVVLVGVCGVSGALIGQGTGATAVWAGLGVAVAPAWAGAAVRGGYRPELDWSGPVVATPMGAVPTGVGQTLVRGLDLGVVGTVPFGLALLVGTPSALWVPAQLAWALAVGALAVGTARPRD